MAPFTFMSAGVSLLAKPFTVFSCSLARCTRVLPVFLQPSRGLTAQADGPPKRPLNGYMRYVVQQQPTIIKHHPEIKLNDVIRQIAQQWRTLTEEQKRPFMEESQCARDQFKVDLQKYLAQLSPAESELQALQRKQKLAKRKEIRRKRELNSLGKPKGPRSPFNIFMSEHFEEARGSTMPAKMVSLMEDWKNVPSHTKQVYNQLAEDDKIRYKNEIKSWEEHMVEIGRDDLLREKSRPKKAPAKKKRAPKKDVKAGKKKKKKVATKAAGKRTTTTTRSPEPKW